MEPSEHNLLLLTCASFAVGIVSAGLFVLARKPRGMLRAALLGLAMLLTFVALLPMARTLWWLLVPDGTSITWSRSPSFYVTAGLLLASLAIWFKSQRPRGAASRSSTLAVLLVLAVGAVGTSEKLIARGYHRRDTARDASLRASIGQLALDFAFLELDGHRHTLFEYRGKVVLLNIWTTTCPHCIAEMPDLSALQDRFASRGLALVLLSPEETPALAKFFSDHPTHGVKAALAPGERAPGFYHAYESWPTAFLIDRSGHVVDDWIGGETPDGLRQRVEQRL